MTARHRVLIVDDEPAVLAALQLAFADDGAAGVAFEVVGAASAEAALALVGRQRFDLIVTDKNLPGDSGLQLVRALRDAGQAQPVIVITGYTYSQSRQEAQALGVAYVEKPFADIYEIPRLAAKLLAGARAQAAT
ncbi:MAG: two-component system sensor histidine kinase/response regulator [bacterium]|nr:two-component system sensor histidine kinase/response regulator [bacterium]